VPPKITLNMDIDGQSIPMEQDTGAGVSTLSLVEPRRFFPNKQLEPTNVSLKGYFGTTGRPLGNISTCISYGNVSSHRNLYVFESDVGAICGRDWLKA
jgi:hypothetical protein